MDKGIKNANTSACKLGSALIKTTNYRLKVAREERRKKEKIVERRKTKAIIAKCQRAKGGISLSSEEKESYESDSKDEIDLDQANDKYPLQL